MSSNERLAAIEIGGEPYEIGRQLGDFGRAAVRDRLVPLPYWQDVIVRARTSPAVAAMRELVERHFPALLDELRGLADGLDLPFDDVFAWNCRGDLRSNAPDGCTTLQYPGETIIIAHNEDGLPELNGFCAMAAVHADSGHSFTAFAYPGSLPGHTFGFNSRGLVMTVNNIRRIPRLPGIPRMVLTRAILGSDSLDGALQILRTAPRAGGFHLTLAQAGDPRLLSVEFTSDSISVVDVLTASAHANHLIHDAMAGTGDIVTRSSASRQARTEEYLRVDRSPMRALTILFDAQGGLPIRRRDANDPDHENTLATALFHIRADRVDWEVYDSDGHSARRSGRVSTKAST